MSRCLHPQIACVFTGSSNVKPLSSYSDTAILLLELAKTDYCWLLHLCIPQVQLWGKSSPHFLPLLQNSLLAVWAEIPACAVSWDWIVKKPGMALTLACGIKKKSRGRCILTWFPSRATSNTHALLFGKTCIVPQCVFVSSYCSRGSTFCFTNIYKLC